MLNNQPRRRDFPSINSLLALDRLFIRLSQIAFCTVDKRALTIIRGRWRLFNPRR